MKILLGDFKAKLGRVEFFKPTLRNESVRQDSKDNGLRIEKILFFHFAIQEYRD
jgi:hypothetical protein